MSIDPYEVDVQACRGRQQRLLHEMDNIGIELAVLTRSESVQWLTGAYTGPFFAPVATIDSAGHVTLVLPSRSVDLLVAADEVVGYEEKWHSTMRDEQRATSNEQIGRAHV